MASRGTWRWLRWVIAAVAVVAVAAVAGPFIYFHFVAGSSPAPLSLKASATPSGPDSASPVVSGGSAEPVAGSWQAGAGSQVGYRVKEILVGQAHTAVGRSKAVTGQLVIAGTIVRRASFRVPMASIHTDSAQRDAQFDGRIMDVSTFPTGTFALTRPISLAPVPAAGTIRTYTATGSLTLRGQTRAVTFPLRAERTPGGIEAQGSIPVLFARWGIPNPSFTGFVTTQNHGTLEFLLDFARA
jgi:polyisoprenoid-binding protein YceI